MMPLLPTLTLLLPKLLMLKPLLLRLPLLMTPRARDRNLRPAPPPHRKICAVLLSKLRTAIPLIAQFVRSPCRLETPCNAYLACTFSTLLVPPAGGEQRRPNRPAEHAAPSAMWTFATSPEPGSGLAGLSERLLLQSRAVRYFFLTFWPGIVPERLTFPT